MSFENPIRKLFGVLCCVLVGSAAASAQTTWYVDDDGEPGANCMNWDNACPDLHIALLLASSGDQIWVAAGTYKPTPGSDRTATFQLITGVQLYGGFDGTETALAERAGLFDQTFLSGDIGAVANNIDNSYHVLTGSGTDATAVLDGFTIVDGNANAADPNDRGGGMYNNAGSPTVTNCKFSGSQALYGAGMYNSNSSPTVAQCVFNENWASYGGGMLNRDNASPTVTQCVFAGNTASDFGGGMYNGPSGNPTLANSTFSGNAGHRGGGMFNGGGSHAEVVNCIFSGNTAVEAGGGICNLQSSPTVTNCTFSGNDGNFYGGGGMYNWDSSSPTITNSIFWGNAPDEVYDDATSTATVTYSDVQGWATPGVNGNIDDDPLFVDADGPDNTHGTEDDDLRLLLSSPCVDAGDNSVVTELTDIDGRPRLVDIPAVPDTGAGTPPIVDMGAYESQFIIYVDDDGDPLNGCTSWGDACPDLQTAMAIALPGDHIWVAAGTYKPTSGTDRTATFQLVNGVTLYGGFDGTESTLAEREGLFDATILSGDLNGDDVPVPCAGLPECQFHGTCRDAYCTIKDNNSENSYHVVTGSGTDATAVLDGFTITGGLATGSYCGGMYNDSGSPTVANCTFSGNEGYGGGMCNLNSSPTVTDCRFIGNWTNHRGGGMYNENNSRPTLTNCTFASNRAGQWDFTEGEGGGMCNWDSSPTLIACTFVHNEADYGGGMWSVVESTPTVIDCVFAGNKADDCGGGILDTGGGTVTNSAFTGNSSSHLGGAICAHYQSFLSVINSSFSGNTASTAGGALFNASALHPTLTNCIFWGGSPTEIHNDGTASTIVTYSTVQDADPDDGSIYPGTGNIDDDPLFADAEGADNVIGTEDDNLRLSGGSPCIDAGDNSAVTESTDLDGNPRITDGDGDSTAIVDMGAYEYGSAAPPPAQAPPADPFASNVDKNRYISVVVPASAAASNAETAIRVRLTTLHDPPEPVPDGIPDFGPWEGNYRWVNSLNETHTCPDNVTHGTTIRCAVLGCEPEYRAWAKELGGEVLHVTGASVVPSSRYNVARLAASCEGSEASCTAVSAELEVVTSQFGDVGPSVPEEELWEGLGVLDSARIVDHLKGRVYPTVWPPEAGTAMNKPRLQLRPNVPDTAGSYLGILDVSVCVDAIKGKAYKHFGAFGPCTDCCAGEPACPYPNALCCDDPACCDKDEAEDMPPECNP